MSNLQSILDCYGLGRLTSAKRVHQRLWQTRTARGQYLVVSFPAFPSGELNPDRRELAAAGFAQQIPQSARLHRRDAVAHDGAALDTVHSGGMYYRVYRLP